MDVYKIAKLPKFININLFTNEAKAHRDQKFDKKAQLAEETNMNNRIKGPQ